MTFIYCHIDLSIACNTDSFGYNDRSEVTAANIAGVASCYNYDEIGNLLLSAANVETNLYTANNLNQYTSILRDSVSPCEPSYDADGNLLSDGVFAFTYDAANRLKTVSINGVLILTNFYDAKSRRICPKTIMAAVCLLTGGMLMAMSEKDKALVSVATETARGRRSTT